MKSLGAELGGMSAATCVAAFICGLAAYSFVGINGVWLSLAAAAVSLPVGLAVVGYFHQAGLSVESIVVATMLRIFLTALLAGAAAGWMQWLRVPVFLLVLAVIYLTNLAVETWFVLKKTSASHRMGTSA